MPSKHTNPVPPLPSHQEIRLLAWFERIYPERMNDPERTVQEESVIEFIELQRQAEVLGCGEVWANPRAARKRWAQIGGEKLDQQMLEKWRTTRAAKGKVWS